MTKNWHGGSGRSKTPQGFVPVGVYRPLEQKVGALQRKCDRNAKRARLQGKQIKELEFDLEEVTRLLHAVLNNFNLMADVNGTISQAPPAPPGEPGPHAGRALP